jgi:hypothetical protein
VKDKGSASLSSSNYTIKFNIISDSTSRSPFLLPTLTEATVFENASIDDIIVKVNASAPADNFTILFELPISGYFKINSQVCLVNIYTVPSLDKQPVYISQSF